MSPLPVVKYLNVFEDALSRLRSGSVIFVIHQFIFQCTEKALSDGVVQAFAFSAHAAMQPVISQLLLVARRSVGAALVGVNDDFAHPATPPEGRG